MNQITSTALTKRFRDAVTPASKLKKKRPTPLSIRLSKDERAQLREWAGRKPLGTYVKQRLFEGRKPRKAANTNPVKDAEALAQVLGALGRTEVFHNLDTLVKQAENGTLNLSDETVQAILAACVCVTNMRRDLIRALGLKAD